MKLPWNRERAELERELAYHLETLADGFEAEGMSRAAALERARREFGGIERVKEECASDSSWNWAVQFLQDLGFGWRTMRKSPTISVAAVLSLALGIGATTAIFSFADAVLWRKIAVPNSEQILEVYWESKGSVDKLARSTSGSNYQDGGRAIADYFSKPAYEMIRDRSAGKVEVAAHLSGQAVSASFDGNVTVSRLRAVSNNFFSMLKVQPSAGTLPNGEQTTPWIVVSHGFWERHLGRRENVVGETLRVNNLSYVVSGVLPRHFFGLSPGDDVELYTAINDSPALRGPESWYKSRAEDPYVWWLQLLARRSEEVSIPEAQSLLHTAFAASWPAQPDSPENTPRILLSDASTGLGSLRRQFGNPVSILLGLVSVVLLVACANIANLLLARAAQREKEVALRVSLGCSSARLMRQFLTESLLMALLGGVLSIAVALTIGYYMSKVLPVGLNAASLMVDLDVRSVAATAAVSLITLLLFGLYPAWRASRLNAAPALHEGSGSAGTMGRRRLVPAKALIVVQVALGTLLVMSAIVFTSHLNRTVSRDTGFERSHLLLFDLRPGELGYADERLESFYAQAEERLRTLNGVTEVGLSRIRPMRGGGYHDGIRVPGSEKTVNTAIHGASAGFTAALGVRIVAGRNFTAEEVRNGRPVALVSERLAKALDLSTPIGARIITDNIEREVIGLTREASYGRLTQPMPVAYLPLEKGRRSVTVLLRTSVNPLAVVGAARAAVRSIDGNVPLVDVFTMEQQIARTLQRERMFAWLCGSFGVLALVLCVVGLYGLMSHTTARRVPEIGIRMALGASSKQVMRQVVSEGMQLAAGGTIVGVPIALYGAHLAQRQRMLPEGAVPYWTLALTAAVLLVAAFAAVYGPAKRASSVDPMRALRQG